MLGFIRKVTSFSSSKKGAKVTLAIWLLAVLLLSVLAPSSKDYEGNSGEGSVKGDQLSEIAEMKLKEEFSTKEGLPALLVFHRETGITSEDRENITKLSEWLSSDSKPEHVTRALPYHKFPEQVQDQMFSEDFSTLLFNVTLVEGIESGDANDTMMEIREKVEGLGLTNIQFEITGPAGISADTISLFRNADFVLMIATILLIFVILIIIYRSPLLAITPLIIAAIVYGVVDRVIGMMGAVDLFAIDSQAVSIMLVLMFAVLTDYSLFIFSRYREKLQVESSKFRSMQEAMYHLSEPILFSGGTIFLAMLALFVTVFTPYNHFAPVFSVAVIFILLAGLTLIPSIFALMGRKAFWPFIPKVAEKQKEKKTVWAKVGRLVTKRPAVIATGLIIVFVAGAANFTMMNYSFNLLKSFPNDMSSRVGFELLEDHYPAGELAPVTVLLESEKKLIIEEKEIKEINKIIAELEEHEGIESVTPQLTKEMEELPRDFLSESGKIVKLQVVLADHPYESPALDTIEQLRKEVDKLIDGTDFNMIHFAGQTAEQVDVRAMSGRDIVVLFSLVTVLMLLVLGFQTRSLLLPVLMMGTILLSYFATMGFGWWIFQHFFDLDAISYRLPVYTFVFMVALGIDYNIMLISRIREEAKVYPWKEAVSRGITLTGGVISSAGLILAATFAVLMTQPLQELFLFGFTMAMGILLDTFIIRGFLMPSLLLLTYKKK